jgi:hypothetical protein
MSRPAEKVGLCKMYVRYFTRGLNACIKELETRGDRIWNTYSKIGDGVKPNPIFRIHALLTCAADSPTRYSPFLFLA